MELFPNRELRAIKYHLNHNSRLNPNINVGRWEEKEITDLWKPSKNMVEGGI